MNSLNNYVFNIYTNEVRKHKTTLGLCLAHSVAIARDIVFRHDHARTETLTSLDPLGLESKGLFFQSGVIT